MLAGVSGVASLTFYGGVKCIWSTEEYINCCSERRGMDW
jgi:hypothetical protein